MPIPKGFKLDAQAQLPSGFTLDQQTTAAPAPRQEIGVIRKPTERERFLNPDFYPVGVKGEGLGENLKNLAQRAGVGVFQLGDAAVNPRRTAAGMLASVLPEPAVKAANRFVDLENRIPGIKYLTTKLPEGTENPIASGYRALAPGGWRAAGNAAPLAGQALAGAGLGEMVGPIAGDIRGAAESVGRSATGTGPSSVESLVDKTTKENLDIDTKNDKLRQKHAEAQAKADADNQAEQLRLKQQYEQKVRDANERYANDKAKAEAANAQALREYNQAIGKVVQRNREIEAAKQARSQADANAQVMGSQLIAGVKRISDRLRSVANAKYDAVRASVGDIAYPRTDLQSAVREAEKKWIRGSPENVKEFRAMLQTQGKTPATTIADQTAHNLGYEDFQEAVSNPQMRETLSRVLPEDVFKEATGEAVKPLSWGDLQGFYEETGRKISTGNLPSDVYQALKQVHEFIGKQMQDIADSKGVGGQFLDARKFYRDYMQTFHEPTGPSGSGSPVAQVLDSKDPLRAVDYFAGKSGDRGVAMLRKYDPDLANLAQKAQRAQRGKMPAPRVEKKSISTVPAPKTQAVPSGSNLPLPPVLPEAETIPLGEGKYKLAPRKTIEAEDIEQAKRDALSKRSEWITHRGTWVATWPIFEAMRAIWGGHFPQIPSMALESAGTFAMVRGVSALMERPAVVKFLTKATAKDIAVIPADLRPDMPWIVNQAKQQGMNVSPALKAVFGAAVPHKNPTDAWQGVTSQ